jgi:hypothetical protein
MSLEEKAKREPDSFWRKLRRYLFWSYVVGLPLVYIMWIASGMSGPHIWLKPPFMDWTIPFYFVILPTIWLVMAADFVARVSRLNHIVTFILFVIVTSPCWCVVSFSALLFVALVSFGDDGKWEWHSDCTMTPTSSIVVHYECTRGYSYEQMEFDSLAFDPFFMLLDDKD